MTGNPTIELLLATYNSERYLAPLLDSLVSQTHDDFQLVVSDDGSKDRTLEIVREYAPRFRHAPRVLDQDRRSGSAMANFSRLLEASRADYVMLVDHDDIWHSDKVEAGLALVTKAEERLGPDRPALAHGDLAVIDGTGAPVAPSFWAMKQSDPAYSTQLRRMLLFSPVVGCTMTLNRALIEASLPIPGEAVMHDWWIALIAVARGSVVYDPEPRIDYRIHGANVSRPKKSSAVGALQRGNYRDTMQAKIRLRAGQAEALANRLRELDPQSAGLAAKFAGLPDAGFMAKRAAMVRHSFLYPGLWRNFALMIAS